MSKKIENVEKLAVKDPTCGRDGSFIRRAIRDVGPRKMPVANGSAGGSFESLLKALARTRRKPPRGGASREPLADVGSTNANGSEWLSGKKQFSRGVNS